MLPRGLDLSLPFKATSSGSGTRTFAHMGYFSAMKWPPATRAPQAGDPLLQGSHPQFTHMLLKGDHIQPRPGKMAGLCFFSKIAKWNLLHVKWPQRLAAPQGPDTTLRAQALQLCSYSWFPAWVFSSLNWRGPQFFRSHCWDQLR